MQYENVIHKIVTRKVPLPCPSPASLHEAGFRPPFVFASSAVFPQNVAFSPILTVTNHLRQVPEEAGRQPEGFGDHNERARRPGPPGRSEVRLLPCSRCHTRSRHRRHPHFAIPSSVTHAVNISPPEGDMLLACLETMLLGITSLNTSSSIGADVS